MTERDEDESMDDDNPTTVGRDGPDDDPRRRLTPTKIIVAGVLLVGIIVPLLVGTYARIEPRLFGFPFFYWYQLAWVFIAAGICGIAFLLLKREEDAHARSHQKGPRA